MSDEKTWVGRMFNTREAAEYFMRKFKEVNLDWSDWDLEIRELESKGHTFYNVGRMVESRYELLVYNGLRHDFDREMPLKVREFGVELCDILNDLELHKTDLAARVVMTFGKYVGSKLGDIPIHYLDQTVSSMPNQWIVRQAVMVVDWAMRLGGNGKTLNERIYERDKSSD